MRNWGWVGLVAALALGQAAEAQVLPSVGTVVLTTDSDGQLFPGVSYGIPADGVTYRWDLWSDSAHPDAIIYLGAPNDVFGFGEVGNGDGTTSLGFVEPTYSWDETQAPGHTSILVRAQAPFSNCFAGTPYGVACALWSSNVWGDDAPLSVNVADVVNITFSSVAIPEPATWLLMLTGAFGVGAALRLRRRSLRDAAPVLA